MSDAADNPPVPSEAPDNPTVPSDADGPPPADAADNPTVPSDAGDTAAASAADAEPLAAQPAAALDQVAEGPEPTAPNHARRDWFFVALVVLATGKAALGRALGLGAANPLLAIGLELAAVVFVLGVVDIVPRKRSYLLDLVAYTVLSIVMLANVVYISFFDQIFSPTMLSVAGQAGDVSSSITGMLKPVYLLFLIDIPLLAVWAVVAMVVNRGHRRLRSVAVVIATALALSVLVAQIAVVVRIPSDVDGIAVARTRGFGAFQLASLVRLTGPAAADNPAAAAMADAPAEHLTPGQAVQRTIETLRQADKGKRIAPFPPGAYRGTNVIIVQVESLQNLLIFKSINGKEITPNLNNLIQDSWYFPNTFSEAGAGNTVDAEFSVNTSLLPPQNQAASLAYADRVIPALPRVLGENGYQTFTLHQNNVLFWNRKELYPALGFQRYWDESYFKNRDKMWHASDEILFQYGMKVLQSADSTSTPFYSFFITESSHNPFTDIPMDRRPVRLSAKDESTWAGRYVGSISYTDKAIGEFIADLKQSGLYDRSILIIYGDHGALLDTAAKPGDRPIPRELLGRPYGPVDRMRIPLIIHLPNQAVSRVESEPVGQVDIMPTVADLLGIDTSGTPHLGRSVFVGSNALIAAREQLPAGSFYDSTTLFMPQLSYEDGSAVSVVDGTPVPKTPAEKDELASVRQLSKLSDDWLRSLPQRTKRGVAKGAIIP